MTAIATYHCGLLVHKLSARCLITFNTMGITSDVLRQSTKVIQLPSIYQD